MKGQRCVNPQGPVTCSEGDCSGCELNRRKGDRRKLNQHTLPYKLPSHTQAENNELYLHNDRRLTPDRRKA